MARKQSMRKRIASAFLAIAVLLTMIPFTAFAATANGNHVSDSSTMDSWKDFFPTSGEISTENAGGVWVDKSVFTNASAFSGLGISQTSSDSFLVALSTIAANMSITGVSHVPTDSILILDVSGSMNDGSNDVAEELVDAANESIHALLETNSYNRIGVVLYSGPANQGGSASSNDAVTILPLNRYTPSSSKEYLTYTKTGYGSTTESVSIHPNVVIEGTSTKPTSVTKTVVGATYIQKGVILAMDQFIAESNSVTVNDPVLGSFKRKPVVVLMSDGAPTVGSTNFTNPSSINLGDGTSTNAALGFVSQLSAAYAKAKIEEKYGTDTLFYTLGLGLGSNDTIALSVMDPDNANSSTAVDDFWNDIQTNWWGQVTFRGYNHLEVGQSLSVNNYRSVTKIATPLEQNYVDKYFAATGASGNLANELSQAFKEIVGTIQLQSGYFPTLISESEELSGYVSFVDKIGQYMEVTDIKGVLINNHLFSGACLASNFVDNGGELGTWDNPSPLGMEMVAAVRARLGLESDDVAATLIGLAYEHGQLSYINDSNYSNYIGWYANDAGEFLGFYNEGTTVLPAATGNAATDPAFLIRSYGYLGEVDASHGVSESDMMYATVQVREDIATGQELVTFAVPAALIPTITYNVTLNESGDLTDLTATGANHPIRLVYEVALKDEINSFNMKEIVSEEYLSDPHNINADGTINFYTSQWDHENKTGYGTVNTYSYFNPSRQNDRYYYLEDAPVYTDTNGTLYTGSAQPSANGTFYRAYEVYKNNGSLRTETIYRALSKAAKATAEQKNDGTWYIPKGNIHVNLDGYTVHKETNRTGTLSEASVPFVDTNNHSINDAGYQFYVGATLGNNGKLTVTPETGIALSKAMAAGVADPGEAFVFEIVNTTATADAKAYPAWLVKADGSERDIQVQFRNGIATVELHAGDVLYIGGMTAGHTFRITEQESAAYIATATGLSQAGTVTANLNQIIPVSFVNDLRGVGNLTIAKEVEHDFGVDYQIPANKQFTMQVTLSGIGTANATFPAKHTNNTYTEITTDANGQFTVSLTHDQKFEVFELPAGTRAVVVEQNPGTGFVPAYWDNGVIGDGIVTVGNNATASVLVINDYQAAQVYPVNLHLGGEKVVKSATGTVISASNWPDDYSFEIVLERFDATGNWDEIGRKTVDKNHPTFSFNDVMAQEAYATPGVYSYQMYEVEPARNDAAHVDGMIYDQTWHTFSVYVSDRDMDGKLEIVRVHSDHANKDFELVSGIYNIEAGFENTQAVTVPALATIEIQKHLTNDSGSPLASLAGYHFGLYTDANCTIPVTAGNGIKSVTLNPTDSVGKSRIDVQFDQTGTYDFYLKEMEGNINNMFYDDTVIHVVVHVAQSPENIHALTASVSYYNAKDNSVYELNTHGEVEFTNLYAPTEADLAIDFVSKELIGRDLTHGEFTFEVQDESGNMLLEGINLANGEVVFDNPDTQVNNDGILTFDQVGIYHYVIVETSRDGNGVTVDKTQYYIYVTVTDHNGELEATYTVVNIVGDTITFRNEYHTESVEHTINGTKTLRGRVLINDEFTFVLTELTVDGAAVANPRHWYAKNFSNGEIIFPVITYTQAGTYVYTVEEVLPAGGKAYGITYDPTQYKVTVVVKDNEEGALYVESQRITLLNNTAANALHFLNTYEANPTWAQFIGDKQLTGKVNNALQGGEFEFELYNANANWVRGSLKETVANGAGGIITFTKIDFTTDEDQYFIVVEKNGGQVIDGITYDDTVYHVWVQVTDDLKGQLHATVHIYDEAGIPQDRISFVNVYEVTGGASVTLSGEKDINGRQWKTGDNFTIELYEAGENYNATGTPKLSAPVDPVTHKYSLSLHYTVADIGKTFYYVLTEKDAGKTIDGMTYSNAEYQIKVVVEDNGEGGIKTTVNVVDATTSTLNFVNRYNIVTGTSAQFEATKTLDGKELGNLKFSFDLIASNAQWESVKLLQTKENSGKSIRFEQIDYTAAGDYYYIIAEQKAGQTIAGITYDDTVYRIHVTVTDNLDGTLSKAVAITKVSGNTSTPVEAIAFVNRYNVTGSDSIEISGEKTFEGRNWNETDAFVIELYSADENFKNLSAEPVASAVVDHNTHKFSIIRTYGVNDLGKTFYYVAKEKHAGQKVNGITYSDIQYKVTVTVQDNGDGTVDAAATVEGAANNALNFTNKYSADKTSIVFEGIKALEIKAGNRKLKANDFTFDLYKADENFQIDGAALQSVKNNKDGEFTFKAEELNEAKTYYFVIKENSQQPIGGVVYDNTQYHITVTVTDNGNGNLTVTKTEIVKVKGEISEAAEEIAFVNEYHAAVAHVTVEGKKTLSGRDLVDGEFKFLLVESDANFNALEGATAMVALNAGGKFSFDALSFTKVGTYYYIIREDSSVAAERVSFDDAEYFVTIQVTDDENGKLIASEPVIVKKGATDAVEAMEFTNVFVPKPADITVDINITKTVVNKGNAEIGPEGFEFLLKDAADGGTGITAKSDKDGKAKFTLTFTEDDIGKIYRYNLTEVNSGRYGVTYSAAEYAITVAITLDKETNTLVATLTQNNAAATELVAAFENIYTANRSENPKTGDTTPLVMWVSMMFISGAAALTLFVYNKKNTANAEQV